MFERRHIDHLFSAPWVELSQTIPYLFVSVVFGGSGDSAESSKSDFAMFSMAYPGNMIMGHEAISTSCSKLHKTVFVEHIRKILSHRNTEKTTIVLDVESGTGNCADEIVTLAKEQFGDSVVVMGDFKRKPGRFTTEFKKARCAKLVREFLAGGEFCFWNDFVTSDPDAGKLLQNLRKQLEDVSMHAIVRNNGMNVMKICSKDGKPMGESAAVFLFLQAAVDDWFTDLSQYAQYHYHKSVKRDASIEEGDVASVTLVS
jgi:hypothetical protein